VDYLSAAIAPPGICRDGTMWHAIDHADARSTRVGALRKGRGVVAGIPDLMLYHRGVVVGIELKGPRGVLSGAQAAFGAALTAAGGRYHVVRDLDALEALLAGLGIKLRARLLHWARLACRG
jgi:hypothetical protein